MMLTYPDQQAVSTRALAWNAAGGENLAEEEMTAEEALTRAGLTGWNVRHADIQTTMADDLGSMDDSHVAIPNHRAVLANIGGTITPLGVVGSKHHVVQNEETADLLDAIVDESGAHYVAAGHMRSGRQTFVVMKMAKSIAIDGVDVHDMHLGCSNRHDGGGSLVAWTSLVRLACTNMLAATIKGATSTWRLRHTASIGGRVQEARESLRLSFHWAAEFEDSLRSLLGEPMSGNQFDQFLDEIAPPSTSDKEGWRQRAETRRETMRYLFNDAPTNEFGRGTRYAAFNAVTEYADHFMPVRSGGERARGERIMIAAGNQSMKQTAMDLLIPA